MPERITLIPLKERVKRLEQTYFAVQKELGRTLLSMDVGNYRELELVKIREKTDSLIRKLNTMVYRWAKETVPIAYKKSYDIARTRLEILGAKKDMFYNINEHNMAIDIYSEAVIDDLIKANMSIRNTVRSYLHFSRMAHFGLMQIQQFDPGDEEIISDIIMDTIETGQTRTYASKRIYEYLRLQLLDGKFIDRKGRHYNLKDYSKMVARTRLRQAQTEAVKNTCKQYQNDLVQWSRHANPCDECSQYEGQVYSLSGQHPIYPLLDAEPPIHPNCVLSGTSCIAPGGLIAGLRARYDGQVIKFTFSNGSRLSVTPNHLLLTPHGFATAQLLCEGDDVVYCPDFERIISSNPYNNGIPSRIEDIVDALAKSPSMSSCRVPVASKYLHGDGQFCDGDIDIVRPNGFLRNTIESSLFKKSLASLFNSGDSETSLFSGEGNLTTMFKSLAFTTDSIMSGRRSSAPLFLARMRRSNSMTFADTPQRKSSSNKSLSNSRPRHTKLFTNFMKASPSLIGTIKIVGVNIYSFHGYVYDLHTYTSLYLASGILSSNCEHDISPTSEVAIEYREART